MKREDDLPARLNVNVGIPSRLAKGMRRPCGIDPIAWLRDLANGPAGAAVPAPRTTRPAWIQTHERAREGEAQRLPGRGRPAQPPSAGFEPVKTAVLQIQAGLGEGLGQHPQGDLEGLRRPGSPPRSDRPPSAVEPARRASSASCALASRASSAWRGPLGQAGETLGGQPLRGEERHELAPADAGEALVGVRGIGRRSASPAAVQGREGAPSARRGAAAHGGCPAGPFPAACRRGRRARSRGTSRISTVSA